MLEPCTRMKLRTGPSRSLSNVGLGGLLLVDPLVFRFQRIQLAGPRDPAFMLKPSDEDTWRNPDQPSKFLIVPAQKSEFATKAFHSFPAESIFVSKSSVSRSMSSVASFFREPNPVHRFQVAPDFWVAIECQSELNGGFRRDWSVSRYDLTYKFGRTFASSRELGLRQADLFQPFL